MKKNKLDKKQKEDLEDFIKHLQDRDFSIGDSFWIDDVQFKVSKFREGYFGDKK